MRGSGVTEQDGVAAISRQWPWWVVRSDRVNERPGWKWRLIGRKRRSVSGMGSMVSIINEIVLGWGWWEEAMGSEAGMGVSVGGDFAEEEDGGDLGEDGVGVRMNSRQRMTLSLIHASKAWEAETSTHNYEFANGNIWKHISLAHNNTSPKPAMRVSSQHNNKLDTSIGDLMEEEWSEMDRLELQKWIFLEPKMDWNASPYVSSLLSSLVTFEYVSFYKEMCLLVGQSEHACTLSAVLARSAYVRWMANEVALRKWMMDRDTLGCTGQRGSNNIGELATGDYPTYSALIWWS
ncbi:hypothetical protein JHK86_043265 [Glycine max]|nr:hypothetical protein JHK86_043265 [Glycine max]